MRDEHLWPRRLRELCGELGSATPPGTRELIREEAWILIGVALRRYLRHHASQLGPLSPEDLEDISSTKTLDLIRRAESKTWDPAGARGPEIATYLSRVARNGLVDHLRARGRFVRAAEDEGDDSAHHGGAELDAFPQTEGADLGTARNEFAEALRLCAGALPPRSRTVWFFRVFYEMSTKEIADHPEVRLNPAHVDVLLQRARETIRKCMASKGLEPHDMPPGCFAALWEAFRLHPVKGWAAPHDAVDRV